MTPKKTHLAGYVLGSGSVFRDRIPQSTMQNGQKQLSLPVPVLGIFLISLLFLTGSAYADNFVGGIPLTTVQTGTVTGDLWFDATPAPDWGSLDVTRTFTLPENAVGNITWARLYVSAYVGHMQNDYAFTVTNSFDGNGDGAYEQTWAETGHAGFAFVGQSGCNDNSAIGGTTCDPYKIINDHENRVTSDYFMWYDVTSLISNRTVFTNVDTTGSYDGRIKVITLVVAYNDPSSATRTTYYVNQGHDVCSYYTEDNQGTVAVGTTSFATTGLSDITSATLTVDYMASNNGYYGFPTAENDFSLTGSTPPVEGTFTNLGLDSVADVQGAYSGLDSWDVTSSVTGSSTTTLGYSRYFAGTGTSAFYKIPLTFLVVKSPVPVAAPVADFSGIPTNGTFPLSVSFTDHSTNTPTSWAWSFGDGGTSTDQNPVHEYTTAGTYTVTLTSTNAGGSNTATETGYIIVSAPVAAPVAAFTTNVTSGISPLLVAFTDASTGTITSYAWDFTNDGTIDSTEKNTSYTYVVGGSYTANLTVTGPGGSSTATTVINATCNLNLLSGAPVPNPGPATLFANENNSISVNNIKCSAGNCPATAVFVNASDGWSAWGTIPAMNASGSTSVKIGVDPTIRTIAGAAVKYTAVIDPDNTVPETVETDNTKAMTKTVTYNGYKGAQYWTGRANISTYLTYDLRGNIVHSFGNSSYKSGKGSAWSSLVWGWNATDLPVPAEATVKQVRLYIPFCWDYENETGLGTTSTVFNDVTIIPVHMEQDTSNFGAYGQFRYGLISYNVTDLYQKNTDNTVVFTRSNTAGSLSPAGFTLAVIYEDPTETRKQIFINEGFDLLGASASSYATTEEEATSYQAFTGMTIDMATATRANLTTFVPWGDSGEGNLYVNGQKIGQNVWNYGTRVVGESTDPQVAVDTRDVLSYLKSSGTGNEIAIQSTESASPCMVADRSFLVVEHAETRPTAGFIATPANGTVPLNVTFIDQSEHTPISWLWDFGDGFTSTEQYPSHTYTMAGTYTVALTATNSAGSDTVTKTSYIYVTASAVTMLPDQASAPTDPDSDGLYEDLNANGAADLNDVVIFFKNIDWVVSNEPVSAFDYNRNSAIDFNDIVLLYKEVIG